MRAIEKKIQEKFDTSWLRFVEVVFFFKSLFRKNASAPNDPKMTLNAIRPKVPYMCWTTTYESQTFSPFCSTIAPFLDNWGFWYSHRLQWWIWNFRNKIVKNRKVKISKIPSALCENHWEEIQDKFENYWLWFVGGIAFWNFHSHWVPC